MPTKTAARRLRSCAYCGKDFHARANQRFCSEKCRFQAWARGEDVQRCYYCGMPANTIDHCPPQSYRHFITSLPNLAIKYPFKEVPACRECNSWLGVKAYWTLEERKKAVKQYLHKKYGNKRWIGWSDEELNELGYNLRTSVEEQLLILEVNRARLKY